MDETRLGPSEEGPDWEASVGEALKGLSEKRPSWETPGEGISQWHLQGGAILTSPR